MRRVVTGLALAVVLASCSQQRQQVPLALDESVTDFGHGCVLEHEVVDVTTDPSNGAPVFNDGKSILNVRWPKGFTAWRFGAQTQVADASGNVVLTTGNRYSICPAAQGALCAPFGPASGPDKMDCWVVSMVRPCPACALGFDVD